MKKVFLLVGILFVGIVAIVVFKGVLSAYASKVRIGASDEQLCYEMSYNQISDSMVIKWESLFVEQGIADNPFAMMIHFIDWFSTFEDDSSTRCHALEFVLAQRRTNVRSSVLITSAIMQRLSWDIQCFFNGSEYYLGIHFDSLWQIRQGHWVEKNGKQYYLKEFDTFTPTGSLKRVDPADTYQSLTVQQKPMKPVPLVNSLPQFSTSYYSIPLVWVYKDRTFSLTVRIPIDQVEWSGNLPASLYGMVAAGIHELENTDMVRQLALCVSGFNEFDQVNILLRLCQSESIFVYDDTRPIQSVSKQLYEGRNDCDGRSVFLYCLLRAVLGYTDSDILFITWPNHVALGVKPITVETDSLLSTFGHYVDDRYYILDPTFIGETYWGTKMGKMPKECIGY
ncbi:hypothetical protein AMJ87_05380 [candidate division WOR_3 bacterium SM23_60]|uniref:Transglutaminase-like domain-containing protein n=1 Tax=candidate division WOR_3 bacterium SM23_60 TaxID=1703780 RepID=A0A0S8GGT6_UNCW3|nr:MAG: hypothetical protein AMJ87_05380 [candidate division WOR_3 bacterium SM23_60]